MRKPAHSVTLTRVFEASADELYRAWTDPNFMRRWFGTVVEADVRVGGKYRVENHEPEAVYAHVGEFLVLEPGRRVVMSFKFDAPGGEDFIDEFIQITFRPLADGRAELTLVNGWDGKGLDEGDAEKLEQGWSEWLDRLEKAL
jgi:uncharacterized protein YndB with AHSA1/START domain